MSFREFLDWCISQKISFALAGEQLRVLAEPEVLTPENIAIIKPRKAELLAWLNEAPAGLRKSVGISTVDRCSHPLMTSFSQRRMWLLDQMEGGSAHYNLQVPLNISGPFDIKIAEEVISDLICRHEILRTTYADSEQGVQQVVSEHLVFKLEKLNYSHYSKEQQAVELQNSISADARKSFDLSLDLMIRATFINLTDNEGALIINFHHIAVDGWSLDLFINEFVALYMARVNGTGNPLPALKVQYVDYAHWQNENWKGEKLEKHEQYWLGQLADLSQVHNLPIDKVRPTEQTFIGGFVWSTIVPDELERLERLAKKCNVTLFMLFHAAFSILLYRYSNDTDVVVGTPIANRNQKELESLMGMFVNTLVLRTECDGTASFSKYLEHVRTVNIDAQSHQDMPFEQLVELLNPPRNKSHSPLFQILFCMELQESSQSKSIDSQESLIKISRLYDDVIRVKFDLQFEGMQGDHGMWLNFSYNVDLFERSSMQRLADKFKLLLLNIADNPDIKIDSIGLKTSEEQLYLQQTSEGEYKEFACNSCVHELFEAQALKTPDAPAVQFGETGLTYNQLNQRANTLAYYLKAKGVKPESIVAICSERSLEMLIGILATLKAGAGYLPLDPSYPKERLYYMHKDSQADVIICQTKYRCLFSETSSEIIPLDDPDTLQKLALLPVADLARPNKLSASSLAYVIYTSGSTGQPKGVMIEHRAIINRIDWMQASYQLFADDVVLQKTPISFDVSVWELLWPLLYGAKMLIAKPEGHKDPFYLVKEICLGGVTTIHFVPSMLHTFLETQPQLNNSRLRQVFCSGEALPTHLSNQFISMLPNVDLHNLYGPTEASIDVSSWQCIPLDKDNCVPIGTPIQNTQLYVLDKNSNQCDIGVVGELYIGGVGLARGYLNRSELTAEKFVNVRLADGMTRRLYRTGDRAKLTNEGLLEFIDRIDNQIKLRGFRVELGEIENQLLALPYISAVTVICSEIQKEPKLTAYMTITEPELSIRDIRAQLSKKIPEHMIPSSFCILDQLPVTVNGKVDRKALLKHKNIDIAESAYEAPLTQAESFIAATWSEALNIDQQKVSRNDDFFDIGGHSLLLVKVMFLLRKAGYSVGIKQLTENKVLQELAIVIESQSNAYNNVEAECLVRLNDMSSGQPFFFVHPGLGRIDTYQEIANGLVDICPVIGIQAPSNFKLDFKFKALAELADFYVRAIKSMQPSGPYMLAGWSAGGEIACLMADLLISNGEEVTYLALLDPSAPIDSTNTDRPLSVAESENGRELAPVWLSMIEGLGLQYDSQLESRLKYATYQDQKTRCAQYVLSNLSEIDADFVQLEDIELWVQFMVRLKVAIRKKPTLNISGKTAYFRAKNENDTQSMDMMKWDEIIHSQIIKRDVNGTHMDMVNKPSVDEVISALRKDLAHNN